MKTITIRPAVAMCALAIGVGLPSTPPAGAAPGPRRSAAVPASRVALHPRRSSAARSRPRGGAATPRPKAGNGAASVRPAPGPVLRTLEIQPASFALRSRGSRQLLLVSGTYSDGSVRDLSGAAVYSSAPGRVAAVSATGLVRSAGDGATTITARVGKVTGQAQVKVSGMLDLPPRLSFTRDVVPVLTQAGCNALSCHGSPVGKAGFKLSMYGFDPALDHGAIATQPRTTPPGQAREPAESTPTPNFRIDRVAAEKSLFLLKPTMQVPHQGGMRFKKDSPEYRLLLDWLTSGAVNDAADDPLSVTELEILPRERIFTAPEDPQRLLVTAHYSDGTTEDVTHKAIFSSNDDAVAMVDFAGQTEARGVGETVVLTRYLGRVGTAALLLPQPGAARDTDYATFRPANFIDEHTLTKWKKLRFAPSDLCSDTEFLRRVSLDLTGTLPTPTDIRAFLADVRADKRARKIDELLERPEYADWWTVFWGDLLRNNSRLLQAAGTKSYYAWIRQNVVADRPYDAFVRELVTAKGNTDTVGPTNFYRLARTPPDMAEQTAQLFLGTRLQCANCHNHPFEKWTRTAYHQFAAFFARVGVRNVQQISEVSVRPNGEHRHPETNQPLTPAVLGEAHTEIPADGDRREALATWLTNRTNPMFARGMVNRLWGQLFGIGIVEPVDDVRVTNPPSNEALLDALAKEFLRQNFSVKAMLRTLANSRTYQLSVRANPRNEKDTRNFSRAYYRRLKAEALLDGISQATNVPELFAGYPAGTRATQLVDNNVASYFMDIFGRPRRQVVCTCEREETANLTQTLHMLNGNTLQSKLTAAAGRVASWARSRSPDAEIVDEMYLWSLSRLPETEERERTVRLLGAAGDRRQTLEDLYWALLNAREFLYNH